MADVTVIGRGARVRGRLNGSGDLEIQGHVDGDVVVDGEVTVDAHGLVGASVSGRRLVVRGAVKGDLSADESIALESGARVVGDVKAPRVAIAPGALVRGYVQTAGIDGARGKARAAAKPIAAPAKSQPKIVPAAAKSAPKMTLAGGRPPRPLPKGPPPPVVPVLKKGAKAALKKK
jgi:cytoskeletal protein CcmA (bactofilin family)